MPKNGAESKIVRLRKSFDSYNVHRIYKAVSKFSEGEQDIFAVIPFLLHNNFDGIEGLSCPRNAPFGIEMFEPRDAHQKAFNRLFGNVTPKAPGDGRCIVSLSLIGSLGTIGQSAKSDFDYVVLIDNEKLTGEGRAALDEKLDAIGRWATQNHSLEVNFYVTDIEDFRMNRFGKTDEDSIGTALGDVFKDEFYRTAIFVAGKRPLWWLTPPGFPSDRIDEFKESISGMDGISQDEYVDLGNIEKADPAEFFGGVLWQMNKAIVSPSKSILKMALLESYLLDPERRLLSEKLKHKIFKYPDKTDEVDPYMFMFKRCDNFYKKKRMWEELRLLRGAFLLKSGRTPQRLREILDEPSVRLSGDDHILRTSMEQWGWAGKNIDDLEDDFKFKTTGSYQTLGAVNRFFLNVYRRLGDWFEKSEFGKPRIAKDDLAVLGRRIFTYFDRKPGKIPYIYPGNTPSRPPVHMKLVHGKSWGLFGLSSRSLLHDFEDEELEPIVKLKSVMEIMTWMVINKMWNPETRLYFGGRMSHGIAKDIEQILIEMYDFFIGESPYQTTRESLLGPRYALKALVVPNFGLTESPRKLVKIDIVHHDSYGEYRYRRLSLGDAFKDLTEKEQKSLGGGVKFSLKIAVPGSQDDPRLASEFERGLNRYQNEISGQTGKKKKARLDI